MSKYQLYYIDNDRQKRIISGPLNYLGATEKAEELSKIYNTDVNYEPITKDQK